MDKQKNEINEIYISCIFGKTYKMVHPSPNKEKSFFFTNNPEIENELIEKGWNYVYVNKPLVNDTIVSSLQSKYIKFLQFFDDFPEFRIYTTIIYFDHKENVSNKTADEIQNIIKTTNKSIIIRTTPRMKTNISDEIADAMGQQRYVKNMKKTIDYIDSVKKNGINENVRICNTGLLIYIEPNKIMDLLNKVYNKCLEHEQPECQIYWAIFSQDFEDEILKIDWRHIQSIQRTLCFTKA